MTDRELQKVKNQWAAANFRRLRVELLADAPAPPPRREPRLEDLNDPPTSSRPSPRRTSSAWPQATSPEKKTVLLFTRKDGKAPEPGDAASPAQMKSMVQKQPRREAPRYDKAQLDQMLGQYQQRAGQAPPQVRPAIDILLKRSRRASKRWALGPS